MSSHSSAGRHLFRRNHAAQQDQQAVGSNWTSRVWVEITFGAIIAIVLLIFILQNTAETEIFFLPWSFTLPLGVALLFAVIGGVLVMGLAGGARIWQLRHQRGPSAKQ